MALFSLTLIGVFLATVRGGNKAQLVQMVHQEGDYALRTMARMARMAREVDCSAVTSLTLINFDGDQTVYSLVTDELVDKIASNSGLFLTGTIGTVSDLNFTCNPGSLNNQVVTMSFVLTAGNLTTGQVQEKMIQRFATSVSTRNF